MPASIDQTAARLAIAEVMADYATGLDSKDWALVRQCFCDEVLIDYGPISEPTGAPDIPRRAEGWLEILRGNLQGFDITHHMIGNHRFSFDGDSVRCIAYLVAEHMIFEEPDSLLAAEGQYVTVAGYYTNDFVFSEGQWRIAGSQLAVTWMRGNPMLFVTAAERAPAS